MKKLSRLLTIWSVAAGIGGSGILAVQAADDKVFPGAMCFQVTGGTARIVDGGIYNIHPTSALTVRCPIVRDNTTQVFVKVEVVVWDRNSSPGSYVTCSMVASDREGTVEKRTSAVDPDATAFQAAVLGFPGKVAWARGPYWLECSIPPGTDSQSLRSGVASYFILEP